jgi:hypothetical protein
MGKTNQHNKANDYAVAKSLNEYASKVINIFSLYQIVGLHPDFDLKEINRVYVLLVDELHKLYKRNAELANIEYEPIWKQVDYIYAAYDVQKFLERLHESKESPVKYVKNHGSYIDYHMAEIDRLCIIADKDIPNLSPKQKKLIKQTQTILDKYYKILVDEAQKRNEEVADEEETRQPRMWYIPEFTLTYKLDGSILVNDALKLKKAHVDSVLDQLMEQSVNNPNKLFKPKTDKTARNISTVLSSAGFSPTLRALFFPTIREDKSIVFRPKITRDEAIAERIDIYELEADLAKSGARTTLWPDDLLIEWGFLEPDEPDEPE